MLTYGLASLVFDNEEDQNWLIGRFAMLDDILMETRAFQEISRKAEVKGLEQGLEQGLQTAIVSLVQARFSSPGLTRLAKIQIESVHNMAILQGLVAQIGTAQTSEEAENLLLNMADADNSVN